MTTWTDRLRVRLGLRAGTDREGTVARITAGATLTPENHWLLICSAVLASIGLDVSSAAVVIGAMLISPLMGPILAAGLGMGITDRELLQRALRELAFATALSLGASALYFLLSPLATATPELIARTRPTLLDVGVAFFGGVAGVVAGSRKDPSLALPGVAIATALMPPLCTAGFGLATGNWRFFFGAFYLFGLNAVFIALATFLVVRLLHFPYHTHAAARDRRRELQIIAAVAVVATLPSTYFLYDAVRTVRERNRIASFVRERIVVPGRAAPQWEHEHRRGNEVVKVYVAGRPVEPETADSLDAALPAYGLGRMRLELIQSDISAEDLERFQGEVQRDILRAFTAATASRDSAAVVRQRQDSLRLAAVARELASVFPEVRQVAWTPRLDLLAADSVRSPPAFLVTFDARLPSGERRAIVTRAQAFARTRLGTDAVMVVER